MYSKAKCICLISALISAILGIIVGFVSFSTALAGVVTALWIAFGIAILSIIILLIYPLIMNRRSLKCICDTGTCLAIGAIGTLITSIIGLTITIVTGSLFSAIIIGLATFFLALTIFSILQLLLCLTDCKICKD